MTEEKRFLSSFDEIQLLLLHFNEVYWAVNSELTWEDLSPIVSLSHEAFETVFNSMLTTRNRKMKKVPKEFRRFWITQAMFEWIIKSIADSVALYERPLDLAAFDELIIIGCARILQKNSVWPHSSFWPKSQARENCMAEPKSITQTVVLYQNCTLWMRSVYSLLNYACESKKN